MCEAVTDCMLTKGGVPDRPSSIVAIAYCISGGEGRRAEGGDVVRVVEQGVGTSAVKRKVCHVLYLQHYSLTHNHILPFTFPGWMNSLLR